MTTLGFSPSLVGQLPYGTRFGRYDFDKYVPPGSYFSGFTSNCFALHPTVTNVWRGHTTKAGLAGR